MKNDDDAVVIIDRLLYWMRRYFELPSVGDDRVVWTNESLQQMVAATPSTPTKKLIFGIRLHNKKVVREKTWKKYKKWY